MLRDPATQSSQARPCVLRSGDCHLLAQVLAFLDVFSDGKGFVAPCQPPARKNERHWLRLAAPERCPTNDTDLTQVATRLDADQFEVRGVSQPRGNYTLHAS